MSDEGGGHIIHLFGAPPAVDGAPTAAAPNYSCHPHAPIVDPEARAVACARCKRTLDPVDVLLEMARRHAEWTNLGEEIRSRRREIEALKTEETRVRARTKSHSRKDAAAAVAAERATHERARLNARMVTNEIRRLTEQLDRLIGRGSA